LTGFSLPSPLAHTHTRHTHNKQKNPGRCTLLRRIENNNNKKRRKTPPLRLLLASILFSILFQTVVVVFVVEPFSVCVTSRCYWQAHFCIYRFYFLCYAVTFGIRRPKLGSAWMDPYPPNGSISRLPRRARPLVGGDATT
jgi:hypothetical protein